MRRRRSHCSSTYSAAATGIKINNTSITGQMKVIALLSMLLAHLGKAHDGAHQVFFGRERQGVYAGPLEGIGQLRLALLRGGLEALAELAVVRIHVHLLARLGAF